jgi:hypothetical protein
MGYVAGGNQGWVVQNMIFTNLALNFSLKSLNKTGKGDVKTLSH